MAKYCGNCGAQIEPNLERCPYCGEELKNQVLENSYQETPIPQKIPDFAPVEITDTGKKTFYCLVTSILCPIIWLNGISFGSFGPDGLIFFLIIDLPFIVILTPIFYYYGKMYTSTSKIIISKEGIEFKQFPKSRRYLRVKWSDFDTINLRVRGTRAIPDASFTASKSLTRTLKIKFTREHPNSYRIGTKFKIFSDLKANDTVYQIKYYARKMNKKVITSRRTKKYYKYKI